MLEAIVIGGLALVTGALIILVSAFALLAASPLGREKAPSQFAPATTPVGDRVRVPGDAPARPGFVPGLVRSLGAARKATRDVPHGTST